MQSSARSILLAKHLRIAEQVPAVGEAHFGLGLNVAKTHALFSSTPHRCIYGVFGQSDIKDFPRAAIKGQVLADFMEEFSF